MYSTIVHRAKANLMGFDVTRNIRFFQLEGTNPFPSLLMPR